MPGQSADISRLSADEKRALLAKLLAKQERSRQSFPQGYSQQRIWFLEQLQPGTALFNVPAAVRVRGRRWKLAEAERAISEVVRRHEILRTTFDHQDGQPVQIVAQPQPVSIATVDLSGLAPPQRSAELQRILQHDARRPFDLVNGPLVRFQLVVTDRDEQVILFNMHHLIADGPSVVVLLRELAILYLAFCEKLPSPLPQLPAQFVDFVRWQRADAQRALFNRQLEYWRQQLADVPATLDLPTDRPRPPVVGLHGARAQFTISSRLTNALRNLGQQEGVTQFMVLLAAFQVLLSKYSGQEQLAVGSPVTGRNRTEFESLIGCFANLLVFPADLRGDPTFGQFLARTRQVTLGAFENQDVPFERLVDAVHDRRDLSRTPLFQVMFAFSSVVGKQQGGFERVAPGLEIAGLEWEQLEVSTGTSMFDLTFWIDERPDGLHGLMEYSTDLFDAATIRQMLTHYERLLEQVAREPNAKISQLQLLDDAERHRILVEWNPSDEPAGDFHGAHQLFEQHAREHPDQVALVFEGQRQTYAAVDRQADELAGRLRQHGVGVDSLVAICLPRSPEFVIAMLGVLKAGGGFVPLDPTYPRERLTFMLDDCGAAVLVTGSSVAMVFDDFDGTHVDIRAEYLEPTMPRTVACDTQPNHLAYAIYTSGSTGTPKAVALEHRGLVNLIHAQQRAFGVKPSSRVLQFASASFDASISEVFVTLGAGATLVLAPQEKLLDPDKLLGILRDERITTVTLPPSLLALLPATDLPDLRTIVSAGEPTNRAIVDRWAPGRRFINAYGPTETTVCATLGECRAGEAEPTIGRPIAGAQVYVLDRFRQPVPVGVVGELYVGGAGVARGYVNRPELTAERFVEWSPPGSNAPVRLYRTGDLVRWRRDGNLCFSGRADEQVKIRGMRVELGEIEAALRAHAELSDAVVVAVRRSTGITELAAFCIPASGGSEGRRVGGSKGQKSNAALTETLRTYVAAKLPAYMVPSRFDFRDALCRLPNGKVDRQSLSTSLGERPAVSTEHVPPADELESALVRIWQEVLGVQRIGTGDNFFALGGHSLSAVVLKFRVQEELNRDIPIATLFSGPTIAQLAAHLRQSTVSDAKSLVPLRATGTRPPLFLVHPTAGNALCYLELSRQLDADQPCFALQSAGLDGRRPPHTTIADMAAEYVAALTGEVPDGPFALGGWSMGGVVALEMAQQLRAAGRDVPLLVAIDAPLLDAEQQVPGDAAIHEFLLAEMGGQLPNDFDVADLVERFRGGDTGPSEIELHLAVVEANLAAHQHYRAKPYDGNVLLFRPQESLAAALPNAASQWQRLVTGELQVHDTPGNHYTMLKSPHVEVLARQIAESIEGTR